MIVIDQERREHNNFEYPDYKSINCRHDAGIMELQLAKWMVCWYHN